MNIRIYAFTDPETAVQASQGAVVSSSFKPATDWTKESLQSELDEDRMLRFMRAAGNAF
jgi:hypothetical protein